MSGATSKPHLTLARLREEIARLDAIGRTRALTDTETQRLQRLIYREQYAVLAASRGRGLAA